MHMHEALVLGGAAGRTSSRRSHELENDHKHDMQTC